MPAARAPMDGLVGNLHRPVKNHALHTRRFRALFDQASINLFKEPRNRGEDGGMNLEKGLGNRVDGLDVGERATLKKVDVRDGALVDVRERQKGKRDVLRGVEMKILAHVGYVRAKVHVREHHAFGFARGAGSVDDGRKLPGQHLRSALAVGGNLFLAGAGDERFVPQAFAGAVPGGIGHNDVFKVGQIAAHKKQLLDLRFARHEDHLGAAMLQDVGHAVGRFVEVNRNGDGSCAANGKVSGVPFRAVRGKQPDAVAGLYAQFH